ncbi:hypothetical protein RAC89_09225 [Paenibacillus sp. GD4]|uniref:hypothetical protein n=1 Tax=Paenibacillus sp. GD4 TaxID=3068890 RepID=UPI002796C708|nr:hypothetical protein [Paenibacillus sp. GD4]MDQ1910655.1 hypothetical protein [Paenibacillus sp. GD4]
MMELPVESRMPLTLSWREQLLKEAQAELKQGRGAPERQWNTMTELARLFYSLQEGLPVSEVLFLDDAEVIRRVIASSCLSDETGMCLREALRFPGEREEVAAKAAEELIEVIRVLSPNADSWNWLQ